MKYKKIRFTRGKQLTLLITPHYSCRQQDRNAAVPRFGPAMKTEKQVKTDFGNTLTAFERQARRGGV